MITIHNFARGARGVRLFWQCEEMGLDYRVETVTFPPNAAYRTLNPLGNVPYLQDGDVGLHESVAIMLYLAERHGPTPLLPKGDPSFAQVLELVVFSEATFGAGLNALMVAKFAAPDEHKRNWSVERHENNLPQAFTLFESRLGDREFLVGNDLTLADIAVVTGLGMMHGALQLPIPTPLAAYRDRLMQRPAYQRASARQN